MMRKRGSKKLLPIGQSPPATLPYGQAGGSLPTVINNLVSFTNFLIVTGIVLGAAAAVGVGVSSHLWVTNVHQVDGKVDANTADINILRADIASINGSLPVGNGTVFFDDMWLMANGPQPAKQFMLNASLIAPLVKTNYAFPNVSGIVALQETLPTTFAESLFAVTGDVDPKRIEFSLDLLASSAMRVFRWPNKDGVVATIADVIAVAGNTSVFLDIDFALLNFPDTTKRMRFDAALLDTNTNRTYQVPNADGVLVLENNTATISNKVLDTSNNMTILDDAFTLEDPGNAANQARFGLASGTTLNFYTLPATTMGFVGQNSGQWNYASLNMFGGAGTFNAIRMLGTTETDRFLRFRTGGGGNNGRAGITVSAFDGDSYSIYAAGDNTFRIAHNTTVPSAYGELGTTVISIDDSANQFRIHKQVNDAIYLGFDVTGLTAPHVVGFPNTNGQVTLIAASQTLSNKILDNTNSITVVDSNLAIESAGGDTARFDAANLTTDRTYGLPDRDCSLACQSTPLRFFAQRTTNQNVPDSTDTIVIFDDDSTPPMNDVSNMYDTSTGVATIPVEGYYNIAGWATIITGDGKYFLKLFINGVDTGYPYVSVLKGASASGYPSFTGGATLLSAFLQVNDTVDVRVRQQTGISRTLTGATFSMNQVL